MQSIDAQYAGSSPLKIEYIPVEQLVPNKRNSRTHTKKQIEKIANSIRSFGFNEAIAINADNVIIAGHARLEAAKLAGMDKVPTVNLSHLSHAEQKAYLIAHNRLALDAGWDEEILKEDLIELNDLGLDLLATGFEQEEIDNLTGIDEKTMGLTDPDSLPDVDPQSEPVCKLGDLWFLGDHRLVCGDSTNPDSVRLLMNNTKPNLMVTDPPYGVEYDPEWRDISLLDAGKRSLGKVENDNRIDWSESYKLFTGDVCYIWHSAKNTAEVYSSIKDSGFEIINQIIWNKQKFAISRGDYHWKHEPCFYAVRKEKNHNWQGKRDQSTVWEINNNTEEKLGHSTQKPVECMARPITNNSKSGDYVYDPFGGSGTTLIACEKHWRKCLMIEIAPKYCDMIINRWQQFTGKNAILAQTGKSFEEVKGS